MNVLKRIWLTVASIGAMICGVIVWAEDAHFMVDLAASISLFAHAIQIAREAMGDGE